MQQGRAVIHMAASKGYLEVVNDLLQAGADVDLQTKVSGALIDWCDSLLKVRDIYTRHIY